jgi:addiction module HigA family antidote
MAIEIIMPMFNPPHPGAGLREDVIIALGLTVTETAKALGISRKTLSEIVNGKSPITPDIAVRLERAFGNPPADTWLRLQAAYDLRRAEQRLKSASIRRLRPVSPARRNRAA